MKTLKEIDKNDICGTGGGWLRDLREKAYERFKALGFPTNRLESWKYINLEPVLGSAFLAGEDSSLKKISDETVRGYFLPGAHGRLVFLNDRYAASLSSAAAGGDGLLLLNLETALREKESLFRNNLGVSSANEENPFAAVNTFSFRDGAFVYVPDHVTLDAPIHVLFVSVGQEPAPLFYPRVLFIAGKCARVKLIVDYVSLGDAKCFSNAATEVHVGQGACLDFFQIQRSGPGALRFSTNRFYLHEYASVNAFSFAQGGSLTRNETSVEFQGDGGFASLKGLGVMKGESQVFSHLAAHHRSPHCTSRQFYKAILSGRAKSEFNSLVSVPKGSQKSDSNQMSRNLLLSDTAEAFARPQLRIDADDVSCIHGATVGQLEKDELFYLRSRGLSKEQARFVMTYAFAQELLEEVKEPVLKENLERLVEAEIRQMTQGGQEYVKNRAA